MKKLSYLLIFLGLTILVYPITNKLINEHYQSRMLSKVEKSIEADAYNSEVITNKMDLVEYSSKEKKHISNKITPSNDPKKNSTKSNDSDNRHDGNVILEINKINLKLPVLEGVTEDNLKISVSKYIGTAQPGNIGNFAIAGHRSYTYGKQFNRLNEIEIGDKLKVITPKDTYTYKVNKKFIVSPENVWVLDNIHDKRMITLTTCHPIRKATHRLIVQGIIE
jgi:sortase A